jgi:hypothetical protein
MNVRDTKLYYCPFAIAHLSKYSLKRLFLHRRLLMKALVLI